jgi:hypothetical protein
MFYIIYSIIFMFLRYSVGCVMVCMRGNKKCIQNFCGYHIRSWSHKILERRLEDNVKKVCGV